MVGYSRFLNKSWWLARFAGYFTWTHHLLFFGNYPSLNRVFTFCHWIKKPKFNDVCVLFKQSNFCSRMLEMHFKKPRFQTFSKLAPLALASCTFATSFSLLHLLQSICHLLKILLKTLYKAESIVLKGQKRIHYIVICLLISYQEHLLVENLRWTRKAA